VESAILRATGRPGGVSCRLTHVYPDGPAPYFTYSPSAARKATWSPHWRRGARSSSRRTNRSRVAAARSRIITPWVAITAAATSGSRRRSTGSAAAAKARLDPRGILNPGGAAGSAGPAGRHSPARSLRLAREERSRLYTRPLAHGPGNQFMQTSTRGAIALAAMLVACHAIAAAPSAADLASLLEWRLVGPHRAGWATAAAGGGKRLGDLLPGRRGGGVWKSDDAGGTWRAVFDGVVPPRSVHSRWPRRIRR